MGKFEILCICALALVGMLFFVVEAEHIAGKLKQRLIIGASLALAFVAGAGLYVYVTSADDGERHVAEARLARPPQGQSLPTTEPTAEATTETVAATLAATPTATKEEPRHVVREVAPPAEAPAAQAAESEVAEEPTTIQDCSGCPLLVQLPPGTFVMGSGPSEPGHKRTEAPQRTVKITRPIAIGRYEVLRQEFELFVRDSRFAPSQACQIGAALRPGHHYLSPGFHQQATHPVTCVSYVDARAYLAWLSLRTGKKYRLPSEAEWEYAARAGTTTPFATPLPSGPALTWGGAAGGTLKAGVSAPNAFSLHEMHGNVAELVEDCWHDAFRGAPYDGRPWLKTQGCAARVIKGGAWYDAAEQARAAARLPISMSAADYGVGFRAVREVE